jgi:serine/threonine protein kinase
VGSTGTAQRPEPQPGDTVGRYKLEALLGEGGMGRVYRATNPRLGEVALKLVKPELAHDRIFRKRFDREIAIARRIVNPHVVSVLDSGEEAGVPYLVQRLLRGGSLADHLSQRGRLELGQALKLCAELADGLDAVHRAGLVHRDVKPANIVFDEEGTAAITDFGLAKDLETQGPPLTASGQALGSLNYMAPEQIRGEPIDSEADIYGLGCVMYECITGQPPFADRRGLSLLWAHLQDVPRDPADERSGLPAAFSRALLRALEKEASRRPRTGREYVRDLRAVASGHEGATG